MQPVRPDHVLIIDEDETARDLYADWFWSRGFGVMKAVGVTGLRSAPRNHGPRLIVSELAAGDLTVDQLFARIASQGAARCIPVIVVTGLVDSNASKWMRLTAVMQSPAAAEAMAHDGVVPETVVILVQA
jgi:DNA-binding NtrC family response regulator